MFNVRLLLASFQRLQVSMNQDSLAPSTIFIQILILQIFYYITITILSYLTSLLIGIQFSYAWVFSWEFVTLENTLGYTLISLWLLDSFICVLFMMIIVGRSKLAWDFAITIHAINLMVCWGYTGKFPLNIIWWIVQIASSVILVSLGTWSTRWKELRDTFFDGIVDTELGGVGRNGIEMHDVTEV